MLNFMPTNDVFKHLILLLRILDKQEIIDLFKSEGAIVSKSKIKAWQTMAGKNSPDFRPMPLEMLQKFISALHNAKLID